MISSIEIEKSLKRYIKSKKIGYTTSLLVGFLITGDIILAQDVQALREKIEKNNQRIEEIDKEIFEILKEGDYYAKTLEENKQFFFPIDFEHRHAKSSKVMKIPVPGMELNKPTITKPGFELGKPTITTPAKPLNPSKPDINIPDKFGVLTPVKPALPQNNVGNTDIVYTPLKDVPEKTPFRPNIKVEENLATPTINKNELEKLNLKIGEVKIGQYIDIPMRPDEDIQITESGFQVESLEMKYGYDPRQAKIPTGFVAPDLTTPKDIDLPDIKVNNHSFVQGTGGIIKTGQNKDYPTQVVVENYGKYNTKGDGIEITFNDTKNNENKVDTHIEYKNLENLEIFVTDDIKKPENQHLAGQKVNQEAINGFRVEFDDNKQNSDVGAFISTTMGRDSVVDGKYTLNYGNTEYTNPTRIFLSVNSAGLLWQDSNAQYDKIGGADGNGIKEDIVHDGSKKQELLTEFKGTLNLKNDIVDNKKYGTLIGIDHQLWDDNGKGGSNVNDEYRNSYSIAKNSNVINLGEEDGKDRSLIGITIETERSSITKQKLHNHVTLNKGEININGENSIGIGLEDGPVVADDLYTGNINLNKNSKASYGVRLKHSKDASLEKYNQLRVFGSVSDNKNEPDLDVKDKDGNIKIEDGGDYKKIKVDGTGNGGFVVAQSLSSSATRYLAKNQGNGDDMPSSSELTQEQKDKYLGQFNKDLGEDFEGFKAGEVNPIANIHGLNIEVNGTNSVGFLRHKDYSTNNKNDMIITNENSGAIKEIDFGKDAKDSVLIRSDMYGIDVQKDLTIEGNGVGTPASKETAENQNKNIVLQATKTTWEKEGKKVNSVGHIKNSGTLLGKIDNLIGMMASSSKDYDEKAEKLDKAWQKDKAEIKNTGTIDLQGKNVIGMAVLGNNKGSVDSGTIKTNYTSTTKTDEKVGNVSIFNEGEFNVKNSTIETSGKNSMAIFNTKDMTLEGKNNIVANDGAVALYSKGGQINSTGDLNISSNKDGIGVYATDNAKVNITNGTLDIKDGASGIASIGKGEEGSQDKTNITLNDSTLNYSGSGYALYTEKDGTINIKNSTINLDGNAFGMEVELGKDNTQINIDDKTKINVKSNGVTVFNIVSTEENKFKSDLASLKDDIGKALGNNEDLLDRINADEGVDLWKSAMVDGGTFSINENISQNDATGTKGDFYFKRFLGVRLNTTLEEGKKVDATITGDTANKFFDGKVTGLEIVSSDNAKGLEDTSITLKNGSTVVANRLDDGKEGIKNSATVGIFSNFAKVDLEDGSSVVVEKEDETQKEDKKYNGVGIFATNGSKVNINNAKVEVHGDNSVGIYALASRIDKDGNVVDDEYKGVQGQGKIDITNNGTIDVSNGFGNIGIYADNNKKDAENNSNSTVINKGTIKTGKTQLNKDKVESSVGIYGSKTSIDNKDGIIEVADGSIGKDGVKYGGVGIYAVNGSVVKDIGTLKLGSYATGVVIDSTSELEDKSPLKFEKDKNSNKEDSEKIGIAFNNIDPNTKAERERELNIAIEGKGISGLRAVASRGGTLNIKNTITLGDNDNRGVVATGGVVNNESTITIKKEEAQNKKSSAGLVAIDKGATLNNNGTINLEGEKSIGMIASNSSEDSNNKIGKVGKINLIGQGNTGVFVDNGSEKIKLKDFVDGITFGENSDYSTALYAKNSEIVLDESARIEKTLHKSNALVKALNGSTVTNNGEITIESTSTPDDKNSNKSVGIVLDETSNYNGNGSIKVMGNATGLFSKVDGKKDFNGLSLEVDSMDKDTVGLALKGNPNSQNEVHLNGTNHINLNDTKATLTNKGIGILANNTNLKVDELFLNYGNNIKKEKSSGTGIYLGENSSVSGDLLFIDGESKNYGKDEYSVGIYADSKSGNKNQDEADINFKEIVIDKDKTIGIYNNKDKNLKVNGTIEIASADSVGIFVDKGKTLEFYNGTINVKGDEGENQASVGISAKDGATIKNSGSIITGNKRDVGIYGENTKVENNGQIKVDEGIGVYLTGDKSEFKNEELGKISTNKNGENSETAIYLTDNAKLGKGALDLDLGRKDVGIYVGRSKNFGIDKEIVLDGENLIKDKSGVNLDISDSLGANGIAVEENSTIKNMHIATGEGATGNIGIIGLEGGVTIENSSIISVAGKETGNYPNNTGIHLKGKKLKATHNTIKNTTIDLSKSIGIALEDSGKNNKITLDLNDSDIKISNTEDKNRAGVYVGKNNILNSNNTDYEVKNEVGIYGKENSTINVNGGEIKLSGKSTGIYSNGGKVTTDKNLIIENFNKDNPVAGGAIFVKNGSIDNKGTVIGAGNNFYGLHLEGNGNIKNDGKIILTGANTIGISHIGNESKDNLIDNSGDILIVGNKEKENSSIGIYGENTSINNKGTITALNNTIGIYWDSLKDKLSQDETSHKLESTGEIHLSGKGAIGTFLKGKADKVFIEKIKSYDYPVEEKITEEHNIGVYAKDFATDDFRINDIELKNNSMGIYTKDTNAIMNLGSVSIGDGVGEDKEGNPFLSFGVASKGGDLTLNIEDKISVGKNGTAIYTDNGKIAINDIEKIDVGSGVGALIHTNGENGKVTFGSDSNKKDINVDVDGHFGFILENGGTIAKDEASKDKNLALNVESNGTGVMIVESEKENLKEDSNKSITGLGINEINITGKENPDGGYTKGIYYKNVGKISEDLSDIKISSSGKHTVGIVLNETYGDIKVGDITLSQEADHSVGLLVKNNSNPENVTNIQGNVKVEDKNTEAQNQTHGNIGIEAQNSSITTKGDIKVGEGFNYKNSYPVGVYAINTDKVNRYSYKGDGKLEVGNFANGIIGSNYDIEYNGDIEAGVGAVAINSQNKIYKETNKTVVNGKITIGDENLPDREKGTGIFASNSDVFVNSPLMTLKTNRQNVGILSMEEGNVFYTGDVNIQGNEKIAKGNDSSIGIYKYGIGNIDINEGKWNVGTNSFGVIANSEIKDQDGSYIEEGINIKNNSSMDIKKGSVGIYSLGNNTLENNGDIKIEEGADKGDSSVGIYMENNKTNKAYGVNNGNILVSGKNSVGVQAVGNVEFKNNGKIDVLNSGIGVFAANGASIYNSEKGTINLGLDDPIQSEGTVGMYAKGENSLIVNDGVINANNGIGMYVEDGARLANNGVINLKNGIGIKGDGNLTNTGTIKIEAGFGGIDIQDGSDSDISNDIIKINGNFAVIGPNYESFGGTIDSDVDLSLRNPTIDISSGKLGFDAPNISGGVNLAPNFATMGNGYEISLPDFADKDVDIDVNTSPLFNGDLNKGDLTVHKVDYKDIMKDYHNQNFYDSLDKTLQSGSTQDIEALKNMNSYLEGFGKDKEFYSEYERVMKEIRGSIYSHVQSRMQDINRAFDNAFDEMESSYNLSKDTDKFSVIYTDGDYKNNDNNLPNYDYRTAGLLYMKEYEDKDYNDKYGYSFGFTGSKFKFDTVGESEENIYSLKGGIHNVKTFDKDLDMITRLEVGLNYHDTERTTAYGENSHSNDADFWSYNISLDNRFRKYLYQNYQNEFGAYFGTRLEYGRFTDIKEDGTLALEIKGNDYLSAKAMAGFSGTGRKYLGNDWTGKIIGDIGYSYDFGENYDGNESKLRNSNEGYVSLMNELETKGKATAKIGVGLERLNHLGVTLEGEVGQDFERDEDYWRVGLRFNYKFNQEDVVTTLRNTFNLFENHFDFDKHSLKPEEEKIIEVGSKIIDKYGLDGTLVFEGHTDSYGSVEYNQGLSERRADKVKKEVEKRVKTKNINYQTKGYSELKPVDTNKTREGRARNRRVEVKYISE